MTRREQLWVLGLIFAVVLPIVLLARLPQITRWAALSDPPNRGGDARAVSGPALPASLPQKEKGVAGGQPLGVDPAALETILDDRLFRPEEEAVYFQFWKILQETDPMVVEAASVGRVAYAQLVAQPNLYRGKLVTVGGTVRRCNTLRAPKNDRGIEDYYQLWLQPEDNPADPIVVICLDLPKGFPIALETAAEVQVTGFFYKRWAYTARDGVASAPTLLARGFHWEKRLEPAVPARVPVSASLLIGLAGTAVIVLWVIWAVMRSRGPGARRHRAGEPPPNFDALKERLE